MTEHTEGSGDTIRVTCSCGKRYRVSARFAGQQGKGKKCGATMDVPTAAPAQNHSRSQVQSDADASSQSAGTWVSDATQRTLSSLDKDDFRRGQELALFKHKESRGSIPASARQQLARNEIVLGKAKGREGAIRTLYLLTGWRLLALSESSGRILTAIEGSQIQEVTLPTEHEEQAPGANARADALKVKSTLWKTLAWGSGAIMLAITAIMPLFLPVVIVAIVLFVLMNKGAGQATELECDAFEAGEETVAYLSFDVLHRHGDGIQRSRFSLIDDGDAEVFHELVEQVWEEWLEGRLSTGAALVTVAPESALPPQETAAEPPRESSEPSQAAQMPMDQEARTRRMPQRKSVAILLAVVGFVVLGIPALGLLLGSLSDSSSSRPSGASHGSAQDTDGTQTSADDMTFGAYAAAKTYGEKQTAIMFWLAQEGLVGKKMSDHPIEAERLKSELGE